MQYSVQFSSVTQLCPTLCNPMNRSTPGLPFYHQSLPKPMSIESVMPSNHLILCRPLLLLPSIFPSIRVFSNGSALHIRWPKYWSFIFNIRCLCCCLVPQSCPTLLTPWTTARQTSLSFTISWSLLKFISTESVMPSNHLILGHTLLLPPSIFPSIRVFSNKSVLRIRWPKYWSFSFSISPSNDYSGLISFRIGWLYLLKSKGLSRLFSNTTVQKHQFFGTQLSLSPTLTSICDYWKNYSFD